KFIKELINRNLPHVFITNNSALTTELLVERLNKMGIPTTKEHILTSSIATAKYIKQNFTNPTCIMIGEIGLQQPLKDEEIKITLTYLIKKINKQINYQQLAYAANSVRKYFTSI